MGSELQPKDSIHLKIKFKHQQTLEKYHRGPIPSYTALQLEKNQKVAYVN